MMNIAMTLTRFGMTPTLLTALGRDAEGDELEKACAARGMITELIYRSDDLPTDRYMAVEGANGLIAAIADAHSLEAAGSKILHPLYDGTLADADQPYDGLIALDGNLTAQLLSDIANDAAFFKSDLRVAPASPGKAERLLPFIQTGRGTLYVNLEEAGLLCQTTFKNSRTAATALLSKGAARVLVTDGDRTASEGIDASIISQSPPPVAVKRITGAGDTFMAAHIAAEAQGCERDEALNKALQSAATYVSGESV